MRKLKQILLVIFLSMVGGMTSVMAASTLSRDQLRGEMASYPTHTPAVGRLEFAETRMPFMRPASVKAFNQQPRLSEYISSGLPQHLKANGCATDYFVHWISSLVDQLIGGTCIVVLRSGIPVYGTAVHLEVDAETLEMWRKKPMRLPGIIRD